MSLDKESYKHLVKTIAGGEDSTPGIYNYCDRWCERCTHTSKCAVFKVEQDLELSNEDLDIKNEKFWRSLNDILKATIEMLHEKMQELDINPNTEVEEKNFITEPLSNEMVSISKNYAFDSYKWLELQRETILEKFSLLQNISSERAVIFSDAVEVVQNYFMLIATKTYRASLVYEDIDDQTDDAKGSAKVTIIIIDRSIAAWITLLDQLPAMEDDILQFLMTLSKIKRLLIDTFPTALDFVRPGFDE